MDYYFIPKATVCEIHVRDKNDRTIFLAPYKTRKDRNLTSRDVQEIYDAVDDTDPADLSVVLFSDGSVNIDDEEMDKMILVEKSYMQITTLGLVSSFN